MRRFLARSAFALALSAVHVEAASPSLIVHEWGTFTSFQDERGATISGVNVDDEPVPPFVHRLRELPIFTPRSLPAAWSQGAPRCHADVTLRLETPVLYFYPQAGFERDRPFDVEAAFVGGWLTEFYPWAGAENPGFPGALAASARGTLRWRGLVLPEHADVEPPTTSERVWLAPRAVRAASVVQRDRREAEKYLFYRGVGRIEAPLVVQEDGGALSIALREAEGSNALSALRLWVVHVTPDGQLRYRGASAPSRGSVTLPAAGDMGGLEALKRELGAALIDEGLYEDEAEAMLETWRLSYFESEGLRVFYVLPRTWTDQRLPLSLSVPASTVRVMLGRVELISPHQRTMLQALFSLPDDAFRVPPLYLESPAVYEKIRAQMRPGAARHSDLYRALDREVPEALRAYESLGRFRDALLAHELRSTTDGTKRSRLEAIIQAFSSCTSDARGY